jgi:AcrR family transcriptional regulator
MKKGTNRKAAGRPRDEAVTASILRAALELADETGFDALSVEGVAARAGVGKTTIYRRWANVWAVVMDAVLAEVTRAAPIEEHATARASFRASMRSLAKAYRGKAGKLLRPLIGRAQVDADLRQAVQARWVEPRRRIGSSCRTTTPRSRMRSSTGSSITSSAGWSGAPRAGAQTARPAVDAITEPQRGPGRTRAGERHFLNREIPMTTAADLLKRHFETLSSRTPRRGGS